MPVILRDKHGYYSVNSWNDIFQYRHIFSHRLLNGVYKGKNVFGDFWKYKLKELKQDDRLLDFYCLGSEDFEDELGIHETYYWARRGTYGWVSID